MTLSRRQLKQGAVEPVFIAAEALKNIEKLTGQIHNDEVPPTHAAAEGRSVSNYIRKFVTRDLSEDVDKPPRKRKPPK